MITTHGLRRDRGMLRPFLAGGAAAVVALVATGVLGVGWPGNPFSTETVDRSPAPILTELRDLAELHAAQAQFEVIVDHEDDVNLVPQFLAGERVQFVAVGTVDAVLDLTGIGVADVEIDDAGTAVTITVPPVTLDAPVIDHDRSRVMNRDRGLVDRLGGALVDSPTGERELLLAAEAQMTDAAARTDLVARGQASATATLTSLVEGLGYTEVVVEFAR
jgi:hypothetical protein